MPARSALDALRLLPWPVLAAPVAAAFTVLVCVFRGRGDSGAAPPSAWPRPLQFTLVAAFIVLGVGAFGIQIIHPLVAIGVLLVAARCELARTLCLRWRLDETAALGLMASLAALDVFCWWCGIVAAHGMGLFSTIEEHRAVVSLLTPLTLGTVLHMLATPRSTAGMHAAAVHCAVVAAVVLGAAAAHSVPGLPISNPADPAIEAAVNRPLDLALALEGLGLVVAACGVTARAAGARGGGAAILMPIIAAGFAFLALSRSDLNNFAGVPEWWRFGLAAGAGSLAACSPSAWAGPAGVAALGGGFLALGSTHSLDMGLFGAAVAGAAFATAAPGPASVSAPSVSLLLTAATCPVLLACLARESAAFARDQIFAREVYYTGGITWDTWRLVESKHAILRSGSRFALVVPNAVNEGDYHWFDAGLVVDPAQPGAGAVQSMAPGRLFSIEVDAGDGAFDDGRSLQEAVRIRLTTIPSRFFPDAPQVSCIAIPASRCDAAEAVRWVCSPRGVGLWRAGLLAVLAGVPLIALARPRSFAWAALCLGLPALAAAGMMLLACWIG